MQLLASESPHRLLIYCHDSVGVGHLRRNLAICQSLQRRFPDASYLLVTGTPHVSRFELPRHLDYVKLPALKKGSDGIYLSRNLHMSLEQLMACRQRLLQTAIEAYTPDLVLVDKAPLGVCRELAPALSWLRENRPETRLIFGMRDIEDHPDTTRREWGESGALKALDEWYHEIWVYGMRDVFDVVQEYGLSPRSHAKLCYLGYLQKLPCHHVHPRPLNQRPSVLVTVGGGSDGERVLNLYLSAAAQRVADAGFRSIIVGGPDLPASVGECFHGRCIRIPWTEWLDFEPCMPCQIARARMVVSMGGFNTLCEVVSEAKPVLVLPRTAPRLEQSIRAERWERLGLVRTFEATVGGADALADRVMDMLEHPTHPDPSRLDMSALARVTERIANYWNGAPARESALHL